MSYKPIADYGLIGDCRTAVLVSKNGSIDWMCLPHFSSDSIFAGILDDKKGGHFQISGENVISIHRRYRDNTAILDTVFECTDGSFLLTDCMVTGTDEELEPQRELLRRVEILEGTPKIQIRFEPRPGYARRQAKIRRASSSCWTFSDKNARFILTSDIDLQLESKALSGRFTGKAGKVYYLSFSYTDRDIAVIAPLAEAEYRLQRTTQSWLAFANKCTYTGSYRSEVVRSVITLKMLSACLTGAVIAAPTSSLPEKIGGKLNWDYRYCWLRDAMHTINAYLKLGYMDEAHTYFSWMLHTTQMTRPHMKVLYDIFGRSKITEREDNYFEGYKNSVPVRFGNAAWDQKQLDTHGDVILSAYNYCQAGGSLERGEQKTLRSFGDFICKHWQEPDHGIWEERGEARHYTYSKIMCWAGLDRLKKLIESGALEGDIDKYENEKNKIAHSINTYAYKPELNAYTANYEEDRLDASLLNIFWLGFTDEKQKAVNTIEAIEKKLSINRFYYRYEKAPGQPVDEGAFLMLSFWAVNQMLLCDKSAEAKLQFENLLSYANDLGLYSEEIDPQTKDLLGNFPQAYTHTALINAALCLNENYIRNEI